MAMQILKRQSRSWQVSEERICWVSSKLARAKAKDPRELTITKR